MNDSLLLKVKVKKQPNLSTNKKRAIKSCFDETIKHFVTKMFSSYICVARSKNFLFDYKGK